MEQPEKHQDCKRSNPYEPCYKVDTRLYEVVTRLKSNLHGCTRLSLNVQGCNNLDTRFVT